MSPPINNKKKTTRETTTSVRWTSNAARPPAVVTRFFFELSRQRLAFYCVPSHTRLRRKAGTTGSSTVTPTNPHDCTHATSLRAKTMTICIQCAMSRRVPAASCNRVHCAVEEKRKKKKGPSSTCYKQDTIRRWNELRHCTAGTRIGLSQTSRTRQHEGSSTETQSAFNVFS